MIHPRIWLLITLLFLSSLACNAFTGNTEPVLPPPPTAGGSPIALTTTPGIAATATLPGQAGTPLATTGPGTPTVAVPPSGPSLKTLTDLNVRSGPGTVYDRVAFLLEGQTAVITGRNADTTWWRIQCPTNATAGAECWVSGSDRFTQAFNTAGVAVVAQIPATPTPATLPANGGVIAYVDNGRLWLAPIDLTQDPPTLGEAKQIAPDTDVIAVYLSPDGKKVAYKTGTSQFNSLKVVNIDGQNNQTLIEPGQLPLRVEDTTNLASIIGQVQWLADSQNIAVNSTIINLAGPGAGSQQDLWTVNLSGNLTERFRAGAGGGAFAISANNRVIFGRDQAIVRANLDGSDSTTVVTFDFINTASEYTYYPKPQWSADGSVAYVAVPSKDPFNSDATAALWRIPATGSAQQVGSVPGNTLFGPVNWSVNGNVLAYAYHNNSGDSPVLSVANGAGVNPSPYATGNNVLVWGWSKNERNFLYATDVAYGVGQIGASPVQTNLASGTQAVDGQWLTDSTYVVLAGTNGNWGLNIGTVSGKTAVLKTLTSPGLPLFDVWTP